MDESKINIGLLIRLLDCLDDNIGIYPAAIEGMGKEKDYKERDGFKNGWNTCVTEYGRAYRAAIDKATDGWSENENLMSAAGEYTFNYDGQNWSIFLNDTWYYACSDGEDIPNDKISEVCDLYRRYGNAGLWYWVYKQRGHYPEITEYRLAVQVVESIIEGTATLKVYHKYWRKGYYLGCKVKRYLHGMWAGLK